MQNHKYLVIPAKVELYRENKLLSSANLNIVSRLSPLMDHKSIWR